MSKKLKMKKIMFVLSGIIVGLVFGFFTINRQAQGASEDQEKEGQFRTYYESGNLQEEGDCQDGKLVGRPKRYREDGSAM